MAPLLQCVTGVMVCHCTTTHATASVHAVTCTHDLVGGHVRAIRQTHTQHTRHTRHSAYHQKRNKPARCRQLGQARPVRHSSVRNNRHMQGHASTPLRDNTCQASGTSGTTTPAALLQENSPPLLTTEMLNTPRQSCSWPSTEGLGYSIICPPLLEATVGNTPASSCILLPHCSAFHNLPAN